MDTAPDAARVHAFLAALGHELRTPLGTLGYLVEMLRAPDELDREYVAGVLERQTGIMLRLVDELLDVSRVGRGKVTLRTERLDLAARVRGIVDERRGEFEAAGLTLDVEAPQGGLWVRGDVPRLEQCVGCLLDNALQFSGEGGRVHVRVAATADGEAEVLVHNTGAGIDPVLLPVVFEPFVRADESRVRKGRGLGLGLTLVRGLVELHGGVVRAESDGGGATIAFRLPLEGGTPSQDRRS